MTFDEALDQVRELLRQRGRVTYRSLKLRYRLDDELLAGVTDELVKAERVAADEDGEVSVCVAWFTEGFDTKDLHKRRRSCWRNYVLERLSCFVCRLFLQPC
jgi:hypothetical protein